MTPNAIAARARAAAREVQQLIVASPPHQRVPVIWLARRLGIAVETNAELPARARWQVSSRFQMGEQGPEPVNEVILRRGLRDSARRFAVAHEIGHIVLERRFPQEAARMSLDARERFATAFAAELLIPFARREEIRERFRDAAEPVELLRLSDSLGVSQKTILRFAKRERWLSGLDRLWLEVRHMPNLTTRRDPRLRVWLAFFDSWRWYVPRNRSIYGLVGSDEWLSLSEGTLCSTTGAIELIWPSGRLWPRFETGPISARLDALRLASRPTEAPSEFIVSVNLQGD